MPHRLRRTAAAPLPPLSRSGGFTAIELIVVMAIIAILAAIAVPSYREFVERTRIESTVSGLTNALGFARTEAIRTRENVVIRGQTASCRESTSTQDWSCGYITFVDTNKNGDLDGGETILREEGEQISVNLMHVGGASNAMIGFNSFGVNASSPGRFVISPVRDGVSSSRTVTLCMSVGGRLRTQRGEVDCSNT